MLITAFCLIILLLWQFVIRRAPFFFGHLLIVCYNNFSFRAVRL